jgi:hypothetical protein
MRSAWMWIVLAAAAGCAEWTERELRKYRGRIEYTSEGTCDCFYLTLHEKKGWGVKRESGEAKPHEGAGLSLSWLPGPEPRELIVSPSFGSKGVRPMRAIRLARGAESRHIQLPKFPVSPVDSSVLFLVRQHLEHMGVPVPAEEAASFPKDQERSLAETYRSRLLHTSDKRIAFWSHVKPRPGLFDGIPAGGGGSDNGEIIVAAYDSSTRTTLVKVRGTYRKFSDGTFTDNARWLDNRYLILPATLRQEIIYVCDIESKRPKSLVPRVR